jgi:trehalose 6-phosphate phosphatase
VLEMLPLPEKDGRPWALFLDVDGTLLELADHPDDVIVPEELPDFLQQLRGLLGGALALVSGRSLQTLDALFGLANFDCAGCHGAELRIDGGAPLLPADGIAVGQLADRVISGTLGLKGALVEIKPQSVALHFRPSLVDPAEALSAMEKAVSFAQGQFRILKGKNVLEAVGKDTGKDVAVARLLRETPYRDRLPVFIGDDVTDEAAFQEVNRRGGISIHVGDGSNTSAQFTIESVEMTAVWLRSYLLTKLHQLAPTPPQRTHTRLL